MENLIFYQIRVNKAVKFINDHLHRNIKIAELAEASHFSVFHFQRLYRLFQGESPYETILRLRLEKAVFLIKHYKKMKIMDIAMDCGFPSNENFTRQFKSRFGFTPSMFKKDKALHKSRIYQEADDYDFYLAIAESRKSAGSDFSIMVEKLDPIRIAFIRAMFGQDGTILVECYKHLMNWAASQNIPIKGNLKRFGMSVDDPDVTPAHMYRYDFAVAVGPSVDAFDTIEIGEIPGVTYVTLHCKGDLSKVGQAWDYLYKGWLPESGYVPLHFPAIEEFVQGPEEIGWDQFNIKCRIPIKKIENEI